MTDGPALVLGAGGALGRALARELAVRALPFVALDRAACDVSVDDVVARALDRVRPAVVYNAAAYTAVDAAEADLVGAMELNAHAPGRIARRCAETGIALVHYSTDFVFDGAVDRPYVETDEPHPLNVYGRSKLAGELAVRDAHPAALVLRTAWLYGDGGRNFPSRLASELRAGRVVRCERDRRGSPTWTGALARASVDVVGAGATGVLHAACSGPTDWWTFASSLAGRIRADSRLVQVLAGDALPRAARRPRNSALASERWSGLGVDPMPTWEAAQDAYLSAEGTSG